MCGRFAGVNIVYSAHIRAGVEDDLRPVPTKYRCRPATTAADGWQAAADCRTFISVRFSAELRAQSRRPGVEGGFIDSGASTAVSGGWRGTPERLGLVGGRKFRWVAQNG